MHFYCIGIINEPKIKFSSCFSELNILCAKCAHKGDFPKFGHIFVTEFLKISDRILENHPYGRA